MRADRAPNKIRLAGFRLPQGENRTKKLRKKGDVAADERG